MKRSTALKAVNAMPKEFELEELIERLILIEKIEAGIKQVKEGKVVSLADSRKYIQKRWEKLNTS